MNLWHEIPAGTADEINVIIENPKGNKNKYEIDKKTGLIALDRVMHTSQDFPFDYGFVPQTLWEDGDPLDVVVLTTYPLHPGVLVKVRPVARMDMTDTGDDDVKIIAVPVDDPRFEHVQDLKDINKHTIKEYEHYFLTYKKLQEKEVTVNGWSDKENAKRGFERSIELYKEKFNQK